VDPHLRLILPVPDVPAASWALRQDGGMVDFAVKPVLTGELVLLRPVSLADVPGLRDLVSDDPEGDRLTGTHATFDEESLSRWYGSRGEHDDRLDLAVVERATGEYAGEVVLNDLDADNLSCSFRIGLRRGYRDRGLGTEATRLVVDHALRTVGLHRVSLEVYAFNPRAQAVYERVGFRVEGRLRDALRWDGEYSDALVMAVLAPDWPR
jgi:RimJ/RimL family protein N-acetyltransferase